MRIQHRGLELPAGRRLYYTGYTYNTTAGSRAAIGAHTLAVGYNVVIDPLAFSHDPREGGGGAAGLAGPGPAAAKGCVTRPATALLHRYAGVITGFASDPGATQKSLASGEGCWVNVISGLDLRDIEIDAFTDANMTAESSYLALQDGSFALALEPAFDSAAALSTSDTYTDAAANAGIDAAVDAVSAVLAARLDRVVGMACETVNTDSTNANALVRLIR